MGESFWLGEKPGKSKYEVGAAGAQLQEAMQQRALGTGGPSAAELMMNRGMQQQIAAGRSAAASMPGVSPGLAMRQAGQREASAMSNVGQQTGIMRAQEQMAAQQMLAQYLQQQDRMRLEQEMYNASRMRSGGMLGPMLGMGGQMLGAGIGAGWFGGGGAQQPVVPGASWAGKGFGNFGNYGGGLGSGYGGTNDPYTSWAAPTSAGSVPGAYPWNQGSQYYGNLA